MYVAQFGGKTAGAAVVKKDAFSGETLDVSFPIKEGESIDRALKRFKRKFDKTGAMRQLRARKQFVKPSVKHRQKIQKAQYIQRLMDNEDI